MLLMIWKVYQKRRDCPKVCQHVCCTTHGFIHLIRTVVQDQLHHLPAPPCSTVVTPTATTQTNNSSLSLCQPEKTKVKQMMRKVVMLKTQMKKWSLCQVLMISLPMVSIPLPTLSVAVQIQLSHTHLMKRLKVTHLHLLVC